MLVTSIFSFSCNLFYSFHSKCQFLSHLFLSSANAFSFSQSKIMLFDKELTLCKTTNLDKSKLKVFADHKIYVTENPKLVLVKAENIVGKRGNGSSQPFLLFPQCFQKAYFPGLL